MIKEFFRFNPVAPTAEYGVEIEMEGQHLVTPIKGWLRHDDGSLRGQAVEWVFDKPVSKNLTLRRIKRLYDFNLTSGATFKPSARCGVHVHMNVQNFTKQQVLNLVLLYYILENVLVKWCDNSRDCNPFCLKLSNADYLIELLLQLNPNFENTIRQWPKYASLNIACIREIGSVEFRCLETPKTPEKICLWIELLDKLKEKALSISSVLDYIKVLKQISYKQIVEEIFGEELTAVLISNRSELEVAQDILEGIRELQPILYQPKITKKENKKVFDLGADLTTTATVWRNHDGTFTTPDIR